MYARFFFFLADHVGTNKQFIKNGMMMSPKTRKIVIQC